MSWATIVTRCGLGPFEARAADPKESPAVSLARTAGHFGSAKDDKSCARDDKKRGMAGIGVPRLRFAPLGMTNIKRADWQT